MDNVKAMNDQDRKDLRKYERALFREDVFIDGTRCKCTDISEGGIYVEAQYYRPGDVVDVTFSFEGKDTTIKGQVQHCHYGYGAGITFIDLKDDERAIIEELISSINRKTSLSNSIRDADSASRIPLSVCEQGVILETLITLLKKKRIISEEEFDSELKKRTSGN